MWVRIVSRQLRGKDEDDLGQRHELTGMQVPPMVELPLLPRSGETFLKDLAKLHVAAWVEV
jgi:hypothetical protein